MRVSEFQAHLARLYGTRDRERGVDGTFLWLTEEVGELAEAVRKRDVAGAREEVADVLAWAVSIATLLDVDAEDALRKKYPSEGCARCGSLPCACA